MPVPDKATVRLGEASFHVKVNMRYFTLLALGLTLPSMAQNWALLNPAYRYNYSDDGTDTISNQVVVTHIDTLGPDSFRYELNKAAQRCIDCLDTCSLRINITQFLSGECRVGGSVWSFLGTDSLELRAKAVLNEQWLFDPLNFTVGTIVGISAQNIFGAVDSIRVMTTTLNDTVKWSKDRGILVWHLHDGPRYSLIGIHGPDVGRLVPSLEEFFPFQPGDVVQFKSSYMHYPQTFYDYERFHIQERIEQQGHLEFIGTSYYKHIGMNGYTSYDTVQSRTWMLDSATTSFIYPVYTAPMQIVHISSAGQFPIFMIADHAINSSGDYIIWSGPSGDGSLFYWPEVIPGDCQTAPAQWPSVGHYYLDTRLGIRTFSTGFGPGSNSFNTIGAVVDGDTIGTVYSDDFLHAGIDEQTRSNGMIFPVPADDYIFLPYGQQGSFFNITDPEGRQLLTGKLDASLSVDVLQLPAGFYLLTQPGVPAQRFVIAR